MDNVLILGAGIFGTSTAYYLTKENPRLSITVIDRHPFPVPDAGAPDAGLGASYDINKIVRADYTVPFYMDLAHEAIEVWSSSDLISKYYHRSGWIAISEEGSDRAERIRENFQTAGRTDITQDVSLDEARAKWNGVLRDMSTSGIKSAYFNPGAGWVEADKAVAAMLCETLELGKGSVKYCQGEIASLVLNSSGEGIRGAELADGRILEAEKVVLATGAWTSKIMSPLEDRLELEEEQRMESQVKAAGVVAVHWNLNEDDKQKYADMPVVIYGESGEFQPPSPKGLLKMVWAESFMNKTILASGRSISAPPHPEDSQYNIPEGLKKHALDTVATVMPSLLKNDTEISYWRLCWDAITPEQHQLITQHPNVRLSNLYLTVGGSFHSWKFLPTIGKYTSNVINGVSNGEEKDRNWAWKEHGWQSGGVKGAHEKAVPQVDFAGFH